MTRRTKILATLGPASAKPEVLDAMIAAGLDAVRLNFSHGTHEAHAASYKMVREAAERAKKPIAILLDLQGPKIRLGAVKGKIEVPTGSQLVITSRKIEGEPGIVPSEYEGLPKDVLPGHDILLDEGRLTVRVKEVKNGEDIICDVIDGGVLSSKKGINVPSAALSAAALTDKDRADVAFGLPLGVDYVALSFVRRASDIDDLRAVMKAHGRVVQIIAKIEKPQALDVLDEILATADGIMVARGDLGVEVPLETVPIHQKRMVAAANRRSKLVIVATQMLESMTENALPTRAEVTDVANAVLDGADATMLSGETAVGRHPAESVARMSSISEATENELYPFGSSPAPERAPDDFAAAAAHIAARAAHEVDPKAVVVFTHSGRTPTLISDERPRAPIVAFAPGAATRNMLALHWGVVPLPIDRLGDVPNALETAKRELVDHGIAKKDDPVVFAFGAEAGGLAETSVRITRL